MIRYREFEEQNMKELYTCMWKKNRFVKLLKDEVEPTVECGSTRLPNSYSFVGNAKYFGKNCILQEDTALILKDIFGITDSKLFDEKFQQICGNSLQKPKEIMKLHSSELCALLVFYSVSEATPLEWRLENRRVRFTKSIFGFKTAVPDGDSTIKVTLLGKDEDLKDVVLFLESRFAECFLQAEKCSQVISEAYKMDGYTKVFYENQMLEQLGLRKENTELGFRLYASKDIFLDGLVQMIANYAAILNLVEADRMGENPPEVMDVIRNGADVILAEILFDKCIGHLKKDAEEFCQKLYANAYTKLAKQMNEEIQKIGLNSRIMVLEQVLLYSSLVNNKYEMNEAVRWFYNLV